MSFSTEPPLISIENIYAQLQGFSSLSNNVEHLSTAGAFPRENFQQSISTCGKGDDDDDEKTISTKEIAQFAS